LEFSKEELQSAVTRVLINLNLDGHTDFYDLLLKSLDWERKHRDRICDVYGTTLNENDLVLFKVGAYEDYDLTHPSRWIGIVVEDYEDKSHHLDYGKGKLSISNLIDPDDYYGFDEVGDVIRIGELEFLHKELDFQYKVAKLDGRLKEEEENNER